MHHPGAVQLAGRAGASHHRAGQSGVDASDPVELERGELALRIDGDGVPGDVTHEGGARGDGPCTGWRRPEGVARVETHLSRTRWDNGRS